VNFGGDRWSDIAIAVLGAIGAASHLKRVIPEKDAGGEPTGVLVLLADGSSRLGIRLDAMAMLNVLNNNHLCIGRLAHHEEVVLGRGQSPARGEAAALLAEVQSVAAATESSVRMAIRSAVARVRGRSIHLQGVLGPGKRPKFIDTARVPGETFPVLNAY